jgi:uncharacterized Fe-S center protein
LASEITFVDYKKNENTLSEIEDNYADIVNGAVSKGDKVAVKVHMGEYGNLTYLRPPFVSEFVKLVKSAGGRPFVTDTTTLYPKHRFTAKDYLKTAMANGFTRESIMAPVVIADGPLGYTGTTYKLKKTVDQCDIKKVKIAKGILDADSMIVLSHAKGHILSGFGGAIKNLAMGCTTKEGKAAQHLASRVILNAKECNGCGKCVDACPFDALKIENGKHVKILSRCMSCNSCFFACTEGALHLPKGGKTRFQVNLAHAAKAIVDRFDQDQIVYINFLQDITKLCDCCTPSGATLVPDIGILGGKDPVAVDKASIDLIDKAPRFKRNLAKIHGDLLGNVNGTNSLIHLKTASKLGVGTLRYSLK